MPGGRLRCGSCSPCVNLEAETCPRPGLNEFLCARIKKVRDTSKVLENVMDISMTIVKILKTCGISDCKAHKALDVIMFAFMHFDEVADHPGEKCKKKIRKEEFMNDLIYDCCMLKSEAKLTYSIVKCAFKAFYHGQVVNRYDVDFIDECEWRNAANKTVQVLAQSGATHSDIQLTGRRILCAYEDYICRLNARKYIEKSQNKCTCCLRKQCAKPCPTPSCRPQSCCPPSCRPPPCCPPSCRPPPCCLSPCRPSPCRAPPSCSSSTCPPPQRCTVCCTRGPCCLPPLPPDPPLCGKLCGEIICPLDAPCPQIVFKDPAGCVFLKVKGDMIQFDPQSLANEARRQGLCCPFPEANPCDVCKPCKPAPCSPCGPCGTCDPFNTCNACKRCKPILYIPCKPSPCSPCKPPPCSPCKPPPCNPCKPAPCNPCKPASCNPCKPAPCSPCKPAPCKPNPCKPNPCKPVTCTPCKPACDPCKPTSELCKPCEPCEPCKPSTNNNPSDSCDPCDPCSEDSYEDCKAESCKKCNKRKRCKPDSCNASSSKDDTLKLEFCNPCK